ncbi:hypothetical protein OHC33_002552 [Knufia fluminis]|uniref:Major facilitator superfamily (MFS) profile domain-containing protein n=1 Tax=Knufia fluminis TaxID=191047 RepID=A0AAN8EHI8_9EURO|nr:hypothetical protein OHC33_002552 [Knufia fluminis]
MSTETVSIRPVDQQIMAAEATVTPGQPREALEVLEPGQPTDNVVYPTGIKLTMAMLSVMTACFIHGLDLTIVAAAVPSLTNHFKTIEDIGCGIMFAAFTFSAGKIYTLSSVKIVYLISIILFEVGSLMCTVAPTSWFFIFGRAVAGTAAAGMGAGAMLIIAQCFPVHRRPIWFAVMATSQAVGLVSAPMVGGALIDWISWRACFGINLPLGVAVVAMIAWGFTDPAQNESIALPWKEKVKRMDLLGSFVVIPSVTCLLLILQWGGIRYGWGNPRIIALIVVCAVLCLVFCWLQYRLQEKAVLPPRIVKNRNVLGAAWFSACTNGTLAMTEYYMAIYFQGVRGYSASKSGIFIVPMLVGLMVASLLGGAGTQKFGYTNPFMLATCLLGPVASGLLSTVDLDDKLVKPLCYLGFLGFGIGVGNLGPGNALSAILPLKDLPLGMAVTGFGGGMGSSLFVAASASLFQNRLGKELSKSAPGANVPTIGEAGLSAIRSEVGADRLREILLGYGEAVSQTLYMPTALIASSIIGAVCIQWQSAKKKQS